MRRDADYDVHFWMATVVATVVFLVIFGVFNTVWAKGTYAADEAACKGSLALQAGTQVDAVGGIFHRDSPVSADCNRYVLTFKKDEATMTNAETLEEVKGFMDSTRNYGRINDYDVNKILAEMLRDCWDRVQGGELVAFNDEFQLKAQEKKACQICAEVYFKDVPDKEFTGFHDFLRETKMSGSDLTYHEYLSNPDAQCYHFEEQILNEGGSCFEYYSAYDSEKGDSFLKTVYAWIDVNLFGLKNKKPVNLDVTFDGNNEKGYIIYFVRLGEEKEDATMFSYIIPASEEADQCDIYWV